MSSRALRKLQREKEEKLNQQPDYDDDSDNVEVERSKPKASAFAMLADVEDDDDHDEENSDANEASGGVTLDEPDQQLTQPSTSSKKKKKKKKNKKADGETKAPKGASSASAVDDDPELDEIDRALNSLAANGDSSTSGATSQGQDDAVKKTNALLAVDTVHLHAQNEMKRLFGRAALDGDEAEDVPANVGGNRRQQRRIQQMGLAQALRGQGGARGRSSGLASVALRRNPFIQGKTEWPTATGGGLGMEIEEKRADGTILYKYVHNRAYQDVQSQFDSCVESMDPNRMVVLLQHNPYHISTLLQVSEIAKQERDHTTSGDLLERALFSFGRAVHSTFVKNLADGNARLDFARPENREFWLASWRYLQNLSMRGTWRTVYEWTKLLLSLSPLEDPYALWLVMDQYALRARQDLDFLNITRNPTLQKVHCNAPGIQFSQSLAELRAGNRNKGQQALFTAIGRFPWFAARLMQELAIDAPPSVWGKQPTTEKERLQAELYATRAKDLWNTPENMNLLTETASAVPPETPQAAPLVSDISRAEARHVILSDVPALIALIPRSYTTAVQSASDPLPPLENKITYSNERSYPSHSSLSLQQDEMGNTQDMQGIIQLLRGILPSFGRQNVPDDDAEEDNVLDDRGETTQRDRDSPPQDLVDHAARQVRWPGSWIESDDEVSEGHRRQASVEDASDNEDVRS